MDTPESMDREVIIERAEAARLWLQSLNLSNRAIGPLQRELEAIIADDPGGYIDGQRPLAGMSVATLIAEVQRPGGGAVRRVKRVSDAILDELRTALAAAAAADSPAAAPTSEAATPIAATPPPGPAALRRRRTPGATPVAAPAGAPQPLASAALPPPVLEAPPPEAALPEAAVEIEVEAERPRRGRPKGSTKAAREPTAPVAPALPAVEAEAEAERPRRGRPKGLTNTTRAPGAMMQAPLLALPIEPVAPALPAIEAAPVTPDLPAIEAEETMPITLALPTVEAEGEAEAERPRRGRPKGSTKAARAQGAIIQAPLAAQPEPPEPAAPEPPTPVALALPAAEAEAESPPARPRRGRPKGSTKAARRAALAHTPLAEPASPAPEEPKRGRGRPRRVALPPTAIAEARERPAAPTERSAATAGADHAARTAPPPPAAQGDDLLLQKLIQLWPSLHPQARHAVVTYARTLWAEATYES